MELAKNCLTQKTKMQVLFFFLPFLIRRKKGKKQKQKKQIKQGVLATVRLAKETPLIPRRTCTELHFHYLHRRDLLV